DDLGGESLIEVHFLRGQPQIAELDLRVGPGQLECPRDALDAVILVGQHKRLFSRLSYRSREGNYDRRLRGDADPPPQAEDRVEDGAGGAGKYSTALQCDGIGRASTPAQETSPIRLPLRLAYVRGVDGQDVNGPDRLLLRRPG